MESGTRWILGAEDAVRREQLDSASERAQRNARPQAAVDELDTKAEVHPFRGTSFTCSSHPTACA